MSINPTHFIDFAESSVKKDAPSEFDYRNAASRAYYAAFHCCLSLKHMCPNLSESELHGSHDKLYAKFEQLGVAEPNSRELKQMAYMAKMMKSVRHTADYKVGEKFPPEDAIQQIKDAQKVLSHWRRIGAETNPA